MTLNGGGTITSIGAVASRDGQHILAACASTVRIYSAVTSAVIVELKGHTDDVTAVVLEPHSETKVGVLMMTMLFSRALINIFAQF